MKPWEWESAKSQVGSAESAEVSKKPWEETWVTDGRDLGFPSYERADNGPEVRAARLKLAAQAPAMARMLLGLESAFMDPAQKNDLRQLLRDAGVPESR